MILDLATADPAVVSSLPAQATKIVGAGAAGIALALGLEAAGRPVVLIESGGDPRDHAAMADNEVLNDGVVSGQAYVGLHGGRARVIGGATQLWHGQCTRLHDSDLAERSWVPGSGWPLSPAELAPWYDEAEQWFALSAAGYGDDRWAEHPRLSPLPWSTDNLRSDFSEYTHTPHLGTAHRRRLERSSLITVLTSATATRVLVEDDRVSGVEVRSLNGRTAVLPGDQVVLAAGAIENARLLMLSDPDGVGLGTGKAQTGRYLQDHPIVDTLEIDPVDPEWLQDRTSHLHRGRRRLYPKVRLDEGAQERERLVNANAVLVHEYDEDENFEAARRLASSLRDRQLPESPVSTVRSAVGAVRTLARTAHRRWVKGLSSGRAASRVRLQVWLEQVPEADSRVRLGAAVDPFGLPLPEIDWRIHPDEMRTSRVFSRWVAEDLERSGVARVRELPTMTDDAAWLAAVTDAFHPAGTTRMSTDPTDGVVDPDGQVHGVRGLFVSGSSVFPIAGYANPTLTIVALALRLSAHLRDRVAVGRLAA